jgi:signal transduction histidine kinase
VILDRKVFLQKLNQNTFQALLYVVVSYAVSFGLFLASSLSGRMALPLIGFLIIVAIYWAGLVYCRFLITRGYTQRFKDPSITFVQILWNFLTHIPILYFVDHELRGTLLFLFVIPMAFSFIKLDWLQGVHLAIYPIGGYACVIWMLASYRPEALQLQIEVFRVTTFAAVVLFMGIFSGYVNNLRTLLKEKGQALTHANRELVKAQEQLMATAHRAGMAEIASEVIHNMGNSLNSLGVSVGVVEEQIRNIKIEMLRKLTDLIKEHEANLSAFFAEDQRANMIPEALDRLTTTFEDSRARSLDEMRQLENFIDQMREALSSHLEYTSGNIKLIEWVDIAQEIEEVMSLFAEPFQEHQITLKSQFEPLPKLSLQRSKFRHVLMNILQNALEELKQLPPSQVRSVYIVTLMQDNQVTVRISDSGRGIPEASISRIFQHGFSTKTDSLGYGLHYCVGVLGEMDAKIVVRNNHPQAKVKGATFEIRFAEQGLMRKNAS